MDTCYCMDGFSGADCSHHEYMAPVSIGETEAGHIERNAWRYYYLNVPRIDAAVRIQLSPTGRDSLAGDHQGLKVYIRRSSPPNEGLYDAACGPQVDTGCQTPPRDSPFNSMLVNIESPGGFSWWIGVHNEGGGQTYKLAASFTVTPCPSECSGNGQCLRGRCYCNAGFLGEDCALKEPTRYTALQFGQRTDGYVGPSGWRYYYVNTARSTQSLVVELELPRHGTHGTPTPPVTVFLNRSDPPREGRSHIMAVVDPKAIAGKAEIATALVTVEKPGSYSWWIGVQGSPMGGSSYTVQARNVRPCPSECTQNGQCATSSGRCFCRPGLRGQDCTRPESETSRVNFGEALLTQLQPAQWRYHALQGIPDNIKGELLVEVVQECLPSDTAHNASANGLGLYLGESKKPTEVDYAMRDDPRSGKRSSLSVVVQGGRAEEWWVGVLAGEGSCTGYTITASLLKSCLSACSNQGTCVDGNCQCKPGFRSEDCSELDAPEAKELTWRQPLEDEFTPPEWRTFYLDIKPMSAIAWLHVEVHSLEASEGGGCPSLEVYLRPDDRPTPKIYSLQATEPDGGYDKCLYSIQQPRPWAARWWLAVRRHKDAESHDLRQRRVHIATMATIELACMADCSGHGACLNGTCACEPGWMGMDCSEESLGIREPLPARAPQLGAVSLGTASLADWQFEWATAGSSYAGTSYDTVAATALRLQMNDNKDAVFLFALLCCFLCMVAGALGCVRALARWAHGVLNGRPLSPTGGGRTSWGGRGSSLPTTWQRPSSPGGNKLSVLVPDASRSLENPLSKSALNLNIAHEPSGGDALSPLPMPVGFRPQRDMRHRRVNSWGTPCDSSGMQRTCSANSFLDSIE